MFSLCFQSVFDMFSPSFPCVFAMFFYVFVTVFELFFEQLHNVPSPLLLCAGGHCTFYMESEKNQSDHKRSTSDELPLPVKPPPTSTSKRKVCSLFPRGGLKPTATKQPHHHPTPPSSLPHPQPSSRPHPQLPEAAPSEEVKDHDDEEPFVIPPIKKACFLPHKTTPTPTLVVS